MKPLILAFIDAPDPDNFVQLLALCKLNPDAEVAVCLTGRPVKFNATKEHKHWEWDYKSSSVRRNRLRRARQEFPAPLRHLGHQSV